MSKQQTERSIPHLRDIFGFHNNWNNNQHRNNDDIEQKFQDLGLSDDKSGTSSTGNDSAVSVGSTSEDEIPKSSSNKKKKHRSSRRDNSRTLTEKDVKHLERHLSMKKTIRKKIMRDLQQAFVEDPNEFRVDNSNPEQLKAEINIQSLSFGTPQKSGKKVTAESNFLDMLRGGTNTSGGRYNDDGDSGHGSPTRESPSGRIDYEEDDEECEAESTMNKKTSFWRRFTMKGRNKR